MKSFVISWKNFQLDLSKRTHIMGIVNVTPDSFSDGGYYFSPDAAIEHGIQLEAEGADILDIGGESTRPFSQPVSEEEEIRRVIPVIKALATRVSIPISIDTRKAEVAKQAIDAGASMINDITAMRFDPRMATVAAECDVPVILMHMKGTPQTMQLEPVYDDLIGEIISFLKQSIEFACQKGVPKSHLFIDPGIGFGKTFDHNLKILRELEAFKSLGVPIVIGTSRKAFIRNILKDKNGTPASPQSLEVEIGTQATIATAILNGAHVVRVHNVAMTKSTVKIIDAIKNV